MKQNTNFFDRISQIIEFYGIKSVNNFAKNYLNYDSAEKINRLKKENTNPSFEIVNDISNKFDNVDMNWLISGKGNMLKNEDVKIHNSNGHQNINGTQIINDQSEKIELLNEKIKLLEKHLLDKEKIIEMLEKSNQSKK